MQAWFYESVIFNGIFVGLSIIIFVAVFISFTVRISDYRALSRALRRPYIAALMVALANLLYISLFALRQKFTDQQSLQELSPVMGYSVLFPVVTMLAVIYHGYFTILVWRLSWFSSVWRRLLYSSIALAGLFMLWFYYYWQLWGFQYYF